MWQPCVSPHCASIGWGLERRGGSKVIGQHVDGGVVSPVSMQGGSTWRQPWGGGSERETLGRGRDEASLFGLFIPQFIIRSQTNTLQTWKTLGISMFGRSLENQLCYVMFSHFKCKKTEVLCLFIFLGTHRTFALPCLVCIFLISSPYFPIWRTVGSLFPCELSRPLPSNLQLCCFVSASIEPSI